MKLVKVVSLISIFFLMACDSKNEKKSSIVKDSDTITVKKDGTLSFEFPVYDYDSLEKYLNKKDDKTYIVNFWATWCKPCVEELPDFERTFAERKGDNVEMILVSLDMPSMWEKRLVPFVKEKDLKGQVVILDDPKMNYWIPKIDKDWEGGIPATLIYNKDKRAFYPHGFTYKELNTELDKFLN